MAQSKPYVTMAKGLITDLSPLTPMEGSFYEGENFTIKPNVNIERRKGLVASTHLSTGSVGAKTYAYRWKGGWGGSDAIVLVKTYETSATLYILLETDAASLSYSQVYSMSLDNWSLVLGSYSRAVTFASTGRLLIVASEAHYPIVVWKNEGSNMVTVRPVIPLERDLEGARDGCGTVVRPVPETTSHNYNMYNQGWPADKFLAFKNTTGTFPSNADKVELGKYVDSNGNESWRAEEVLKSFLGNTQAPRGKVIRSVLKDNDVGYSGDLNFIEATWYDGSSGTQYAHYMCAQDHNLQAGDFIILYTTNGRGIPLKIEAGYVDIPTAREIRINTYTTWVGEEWTTGIGLAIRKVVNEFYWYDTQMYNSQHRTYTTSADFQYVSNKSFKAVEVWSSRLWFSGLTGKKQTRVYFSQMLDSDYNFYKFYSLNDPTSEISDPLHADGGYLIIPEAVNIVGLYGIRGGLLVFAKNGVWKISGTVNGAFSATDYQVEKITDFGAVSPRGFATLNDVVYYASLSGICAIDGKGTVENVTKNLIDAEWRKIPVDNIPDIQMISNQFDDTVHVLYSDYDMWSNYDKELIFNAGLKSWYKYSYSVAINQYIVGAFATNVHTDTDKQMGYITGIRTDNNVEYVHLMTNTGTAYKDFVCAQFTGAYFNSYMKTAIENLGDLSKTKATGYIKLYKYNNVDNDFTITAVWDWMVKDKTKRQITLTALNKYDDQYQSNKTLVAIVKDQIVGSGDSLYLSIDSKPGKHCTIYGWSIDWSGRAAT